LYEVVLDRKVVLTFVELVIQRKVLKLHTETVWFLKNS